MTHHTAIIKRPRLRFRFIGNIISELGKVVWLSRREVMYLSTLVLIVSIIAGLALGAVDFGFTGLIEKFFLSK